MEDDELSNGEDEATYKEITRELIKAADELLDAEDDVIVSRYLKRIIVNEDAWEGLFTQDVDVFETNPYEEFDSESSTFLIVEPRTKNCGKADGCESGCWRIMGRDKLIKSKETGKVLGFKKILKFCVKRKPREYKRSWVMEEFRLTNNLNWNQDPLVICKIRFLFEAETSSLLAKHFSYLSTTEPVPVPASLLLPAYGFKSIDQRKADEAHVLRIPAVYQGKNWPSHVTNNVYRLNPWKLVDLHDQMFRNFGTCIFANQTCGDTDKCDGGYWRILHPDVMINSRSSGETIGFKKVLKFYETEKQRFVREGEEINVTWTIDEYRLVDKEMQNKVLSVIKITTKDN
ncbi:PREDICTED: uncharacterized protein LOC104789348 [Camelina sativa]|uniref:Uncharacterized protein LOC104789348 n=1 Tax=Camelina sativa TaxID=90675 RepID=A0ABM0ZBP5_CAMSA|nr:PREDICTED: uncharacterized protein LOC104789348 [Camelina sativa]